MVIVSEAPLISGGALPGFVLRPGPPITRVMGLELSRAGSTSALRAIDTENPSLTARSAAFRLAGVMRFTAPTWSSLPQRPQLDSSFINRSKSARVASWFETAWRGGAEAARTENATAAARTNRDPTARLWSRRVTNLSVLQRRQSRFATR